VVVAGPGDRRDEDIRAIAHQVAGRFDHYICRRDDGLRGRADSEVPNMIAESLRERGVPPGAIEVIPDEQAAIAAALAMGRPGDLILVFADALTRSWKQIIKFKPSSGEETTPVAPSQASEASRPPAHRPLSRQADEEASASIGGAGAGAGAGAGMGNASLESRGFVREERGLRFVGEAAD
jgi:cyanophycin synthetase